MGADPAGRGLGRLLDPRTVAVIGGRPAEQAVRQSALLGFTGEIWPVHPSRRTMAGRRVYRSLDALPAAPDAAFAAVNRRLTVETVQELAALGCGGAVVYASGFAEAGPEGAALQKQLTAGHGMPIVGPNCYGALNLVTGAALWPDIHGCRRVKTGPALISQSGNLTLNLTFNRRGVDFSCVVSLGNQASVTAEECLAHLADRPEATAAGLYLESITDPLAFGRAALAWRRARKPVAVLKTGRTAQAGAITSSHTAALAGEADAYDALFERYGVIAVDTPAELVNVLGVLGTIGPLPGNRLVSLSCSGGEAALAADRAVHHRVRFDPFPPGQAARVRAALSGRTAVHNPLDYHTFIWGDQPALERCFTEALSGPFDAALLALDWPPEGCDDSDWRPALLAFENACAAAGKPGLAAAGLAENMPPRIRERLGRRGLAAACSIDEALGGLAAAAAAGRWFAQAPPPLHLSAGGPPAAGRGPPPAVRTLDEPSSKTLLRRAGVAVPDGAVLGGGGPGEEVGWEAAARLRFPLAAKMVGPDHKAEQDGVITGIRTAEELEDAVRRLGGPAAPVLVEEQITGGAAELLVSVRRAPPVGLVLTLGAGGGLVELLDDTAALLLPASRADLDRALDRLRIGRLLRGFRGRPPADLGAVAAAVDRLAALLAGRPELAELEINPLIATPDGAWAVDALASVYLSVDRLPQR